MINIADGRQYRAFDFSSEGEKIEGYAVVFESPTVIDSDPYTGTDFYEVISRNAFDECDLTDVILNVDHEGTPLARTRAGTLCLTIDDRGLKVSAQLNTARGREVWEEVRAGNLDKMSFAFNTAKESYDSHTRTRTIEKISKLWDVSIVTRPAYEATCVYARASVAGHMEQERRNYVSKKLEEMRTAVVQQPKVTGEQLKRNLRLGKGGEMAGALLDLQRRSELIGKIAEIRAWKPEGTPEDVQSVNQKAETLADMIRAVEDLDNVIDEKTEICKRNHVPYGFPANSKGFCVAPDVETFVALDMMTGRGCALIAKSHMRQQARALSRERIEWIAKAIDVDPQTIIDHYAMTTREQQFNNPTYYGKKEHIKMDYNSNNMEMRALQSYLCKGVSQMDETERRALTTTGSGAAVIPTNIADRIISNAGYSILAHRATRLADGRPGKIVIPVAGAAGGVGWHEELTDITAYDETFSSITISGAELVKLVLASRAMVDMATDHFETYLINLLSGEMLDVLEDSFVTGKAGTNNCPSNGLDNLTLTARTVTATTSITIEDIAEAVALLPAKVQHGALIMGNAATLAGILTAKGEYAFDVRSTLKDMGLELVQNPHVSDNTLYIIGEPSQTLFLNFWQNIAVRRSEEAALMKNAVAFLASTVCGFAWHPDYVAKVVVGS